MKNYLIESLASYMGKLEEARNPEDEHDNCTFSMNPTIKKLVDDGNFSELVKYNTIYDIPPEYAKKLKNMCSENGYHCSVNRGGKNYWIKISDKKSNLDESSTLKEDINTPFIKIYKEGQLAKEGWDYPVEELDYLLEEHPGESFVLKNNRLYEMTEE